MKTIHENERYTIRLGRRPDGALEAVKTDSRGNSSHEDYYPERDVSALAGEATEMMAWQILRDVASEVEAGTNVPVEPSHIMIRGEARFCLNPWSRSINPAFTAPEGYEAVWALGATVFFLVLGCGVFQGGGGSYQRATTPVPVMRRNAPELSALVGRCLSFKPSARPKVKEIKEMALRAIERLEAAGPGARPLKTKKTAAALAPDRLEELWPEKID